MPKICLGLKVLIFLILNIDLSKFPRIGTL